MTEKQLDILLHWAGALGILIVGYIVVRICLGIVGRGLKKSNLDEALHSFILSVLRVFLYIVVLITCLGYLSIPISTFVAVLGAAGAAIALALKDSLGNVAGGILILINKPFKRGDYIDIGNASGTVDNISLFMTTLKSIDNKVITVPNGIVSTSVLTNYTAADKRRVDCVFGVSSVNQIAQAKALLFEVAGQCNLLLEDEEPLIGVSGQKDGWVSLDLKVWCKTQDYWTVKYFLEENVRLAFEEAGIPMAVSQMEVQVLKRGKQR